MTNPQWVTYVWRGVVLEIEGSVGRWLLNWDMNYRTDSGLKCAMDILDMSYNSPFPVSDLLVVCNSQVVDSSALLWVTVFNLGWDTLEGGLLKEEALFGSRLPFSILICCFSLCLLGSQCSSPPHLYCISRIWLQTYFLPQRPGSPLSCMKWTT